MLRWPQEARSQLRSYAATQLRSYAATQLRTTGGRRISNEGGRIFRVNITYYPDFAGAGSSSTTSTSTSSSGSSSSSSSSSTSITFTVTLKTTSSSRSSTFCARVPARISGHSLNFRGMLVAAPVGVPVLVLVSTTSSTTS
jgi:hypothetical protein